MLYWRKAVVERHYNSLKLTQIIVGTLWYWFVEFPCNIMISLHGLLQQEPEEGLSCLVFRAREARQCGRLQYTVPLGARTNPLSSPRTDKTLIWRTISPRSCPTSLPRYLPLPPALLDCSPSLNYFKRCCWPGLPLSSSPKRNAITHLVSVGLTVLALPSSAGRLFPTLVYT